MASLEAAKCSRVFKKLRGVLIRELPDPAVMVEMPELKEQFSGYEKSQITSPATMHGRAEKFVDVMELCSNERVFQKLFSLLKKLKPDLARGLEGALGELDGTPSAGSSNRAELSRNSDGASASPNANERLGHPVAMGDRQPQAMNQRQHHVEEDAGPFGLNGYGEDAQCISYLSYNCREYLASELNAHPPARETFHDFCRALGVENRLVQASARSRNPTGYLLQKCAEQPLVDLHRALTEIGKGHVFQELQARMRNDGGLPDDDV